MKTSEIVARRIGDEQQPIVIVDGFHPDPDALRDAAIARPFEPGRRHYPGVRAALPGDYFQQVRGVLVRVLREVFGHGGAIDLIDASFSIVTTSPTALTLEQRLPHVDAIEPGRIALVHYLAHDDGDGTAFFRHRASGYETIDALRGRDYFPQLERELRGGAMPVQGYLAGDTPLFARTATVDARFNRAVIYRSAMLHSGAISPDARLDADPATGRLTVTAFLSAA